jgi:hypothetical protein
MRTSYTWPSLRPTAHWPAGSASAGRALGQLHSPALSNLDQSSAQGNPGFLYFFSPSIADFSVLLPCLAQKALLPNTHCTRAHIHRSPPKEPTPIHQYSRSLATHPHACAPFGCRGGREREREQRKEVQKQESYTRSSCLPALPLSFSPSLPDSLRQPAAESTCAVQS